MHDCYSYRRMSSSLVMERRAKAWLGDYDARRLCCLRAVVIVAGEATSRVLPWRRLRPGLRSRLKTGLNKTM
jgi:hypothetical protein